MTDSCFHARRLGHVNITASSTPTLRDFYLDVLGLEEVFEVTELSAAFFSNGNTHHDVALVQAHEKRPVGLGHLGIELASEQDLLTGMASFDERGIKPLMIYNHQTSVSAYLRDPNGHLVEFYWDVIEDWRGFFKDHWGERIGSLWLDVTPLDEARPGHNFADQPQLRTPPSQSAGVSWLLAAGLTVVDLDQSISYYKSIGGMSVLHRSDGAALLGGSLGQPDLALIESPTAGFHSTVYVADPGHSLEDSGRALASTGRPVHRSDHAVTTTDPDGTLVSVLDATHPTGDAPVVLDLLVGPR